MPRTTAVGIGSKKAWRPVTHNSRVFGKLRATCNSYFPKGTRRLLLIYNGLEITLPSSVKFRYLLCGLKSCKNRKKETKLGRPANDIKQNETIKENGQLIETKEILTFFHANKYITINFNTNKESKSVECILIDFEVIFL